MATVGASFLHDRYPVRSCPGPRLHPYDVSTGRVLLPRHAADGSSRAIALTQDETDSRDFAHAANIIRSGRYRPTLSEDMLWQRDTNRLVSPSLFLVSLSRDHDCIDERNGPALDLYYLPASAA